MKQWPPLSLMMIHQLDAPAKLMQREGSSSEAFSDNEEEKAEEKPEEKPVKARKSAGARNVSATVEFWGAEDGVEHKLDVHRFVLMDADVGYKKQTRSGLRVPGKRP